MSGSGISWDICKSATRSRQITMPVPHHSVFYRPDALPATQPTASKHWRHVWPQTTIMSKMTVLWGGHVYYFWEIGWQVKDSYFERADIDRMRSRWYRHLNVVNILFTFRTRPRYLISHFTSCFFKLNTIPAITAAEYKPPQPTCPCHHANAATCDRPTTETVVPQVYSDCKSWPCYNKLTRLKCSTN